MYSELRATRLLPGPLPMMQCSPYADFLTLHGSVPWSLTAVEGTTERDPGKEAKLVQHTMLQFGEETTMEGSGEQDEQAPRSPWITYCRSTRLSSTHSKT